jgi:hypothetical protein
MLFCAWVTLENTEHSEVLEASVLQVQSSHLPYAFLWRGCRCYKFPTLTLLSYRLQEL